MLDIGDFLTAVSIVLSAYFGTKFTFHRINKRWELQRKTLSIREMSRLWQNDSFQKDIVAVVKIAAEEGMLIERYAMKQADIPGGEQEEWKKKRDQIIRTVNYFEIVAAGVFEEIYDLNIINRTIKSQVIMLFGSTEPFIKKVRNLHNHPSFGEGFEWFAKTLRNGDELRYPL